MTTFKALSAIIVFGLTMTALNPGALETADKEFANQNFATALEHYRKALTEVTEGKARDHVRRRLGHCLSHLQRHDKAFEAFDVAVEKAESSVAKFEATLDRGLAYATAPDYYYEKDGKVSWGTWIQGSTYHYVANEHRRAAARDLSSALVGLTKVAGEGGSAKSLSRAKGLHYIAGLELASLIERVANSDAAVLDKVYEILEIPAPEDQKLRYAKAMAHCFDEVGKVQSSAEETGPRNMAVYLKAMAFRRFIEGSGYVDVVDGKCRWRGAEGPVAALPDEWNPLKLLESIRASSAKGALGPEVVMAIATIQRSQGLFVDSVATARRLMEAWPKHALAEDAKAMVDVITLPRLSINSGPAVASGTEPTLQISSRNVTEIGVRVFRFDFDAAMARLRAKRDSDVSLTSSEAMIKLLGRAPRTEDVVATLSHLSGDNETHQFLEGDLKLPVDTIGCYLVEASAGGLIVRELVLVSDMVTIRRCDGEKMMAFVSDAQTGQPQADAKVTFLEKINVQTLFGRRWKLKVHEVTTNEKGWAEAGYSDSDRSNRYVACAAQHGDNHALMDFSWCEAKSGTRVRHTGYIISDRPVYRPSQMVSIAGILRSKEGLEYTNLPDETVTVRVSDPKGQELFNEALTTHQDGDFNFQLTLGEEPPLGNYRIRVNRGNTRLARGNFRVEEYKRPEFEVKVEAPDRIVRIGEALAATIRADYYFGAPVTEAQVQWRVFRERFYPSFRVSEPYRELYGDIPRNVDPSDRGRGRELVAEGSGVLDPDGKLVIEWSSKTVTQTNPDQDHLFIVQADVTDASRRTISGSGRVPVTHRGFQVHLSTERAFLTGGEVSTFEIQTQLPSGRPLATEGLVRVYRVTEELRDGKPFELLTQVLEEKASTDEHGVGFYRWQSDEAGRFAISYQAKDDRGEIVRGDIPIWVYKPGFRAANFQMKNLEIITDKRVYEPGEEALVMVNSNFENASVLYFVSAGAKTLSKDVVRLDGKTMVFRIPIVESMCPNIHIYAYMVHDGQVFGIHHELLVPPTRNLLNVEMAFDKESYKPGEEGQLNLKVSDHDGNPVEATVAVKCYDASLLYIQQDQTTDIRRHFYGSRQRARSWTGNTIGFDFHPYMVKSQEWPERDTRGWLPAWWNQQGRIRGLIKRGVFGQDEILQRELLDLSEGVVTLAERKRGSKSRGGRSMDMAGSEDSRGLLSTNASSARPAPAAAMAPGESEEVRSQNYFADGEKGADKDSGDVVEVRSDFRETAAWEPRVRTSAAGTASIKIPFPDSLTTWNATAYVWNAKTQVGTTGVSTYTSKDLMVRLQAPRFFQEGDRLMVSAIVNNRLDQPVPVTVNVDLGESGTLRLGSEAARSLEVPPLVEQRVDWWVDVIKVGEATVSVTARSASDSDAMRQTFPVQRWGAHKTITETTILTNGGESVFTVNVPEARDPAASHLAIEVQPSMAGLMLEALPYLIDYPYGCTEQTMSRFVPAVACAKALQEAGTSLEEIAKARKALAKVSERGAFSGIFTQRRLQDVIAVGLKRIADMQSSDGGWGWWKRDTSSPYLTAYVLSGLQIARDADIAVNDSMYTRGVEFLAGRMDKIEQADTAIYVARVLSDAGRAPKDVLKRLFAARGTLSVYGQALLAQALHSAGMNDQADLVVQNFENTVQVDEVSGTVSWQPTGYRWRWWGSNIETNAAVLHALVDVRPDHKWTMPLVKWLVRNRQGNRWSNTRDTAQCILALMRYARASGELSASYELEIAMGDLSKTIKVAPSNLFSFDNTFLLEGDAVQGGTHEIHVKQSGKGRAYVTAKLKVFTKEERIQGAGYEFLVDREYYKVTEKRTTETVNGRTVNKLADVFERISEDAVLDSGTMVEVRLKLRANNDFTYLLVEDMKPSGWEPLKLRSGGDQQNGICSNMELRDERTAFFISWLQQGNHTLTYRLRAEVPGTLRALPARCEAMYAPEFGGISDSFRIQVKDLVER